MAWSWDLALRSRGRAVDVARSAADARGSGILELLHPAGDPPAVGEGADAEPRLDALPETGLHAQSVHDGVDLRPEGLHLVGGRVMGAEDLVVGPLREVRHGRDGERRRDGRRLLRPG